MTKPTMNSNPPAKMKASRYRTDRTHMAGLAAGIRVRAYSRRRDFKNLVPSNTPPMASATGTPAPIEGAGTPCSTHVTDEQTEEAACAPAIPMTNIKMLVAKDFMCASREGPKSDWPRTR
jgi:hypothetical protein